jgi:hypothetical protein
VIGMNFFEVFKPNNLWGDLVNDAITRLNAGEPIYKVFRSCSDFVEGFAIVKLRNKYNFINQEGKILSPNQWFDSCCPFKEGFGIVSLIDKFTLNDKFTFIKPDGTYLINQWFDNCDDFYNGFGIVELEDKEYYINNEGQIIGEVNENTNKLKKIYINESQLDLLTES